MFSKILLASLVLLMTQLAKIKSQSIDLVPDLPPGICVLPSDLGNQGRASLIEDCDTIDYFPDDQPPLILGFRGSTVIICCPLKRPEPFSEVVFPGEEGSDLDNIDKDEEEENGDDLPEDYSVYADYLEYTDALNQEDRCVSLPGTECKALNECVNEDFTGPSPPIICGWSSELRQHRLCCSSNNTAGTARFEPGLRSNSLYKCEDHSPSCARWSAGNPGSCNGGDADNVDPVTIFMATACQKSCNHCDMCVDEFAMCQSWTRNTFCVIMPDFMSFFCRASCGTCGFNSPHNNEMQMEGDRLYSDIDDSRFHCGATSKLSEINESIDVRPRSDSDAIIFGRTKRQTVVEEDETGDDSKSGFFYYATESSKSNRGIRCGAVSIDDRFVIMAAHCNVHYSVPSGEEETLTILIRDDTQYRERVAVRRIINHPGFKQPELYYDIAVIELARRIDYDFSKYGDSPACLGSGIEITGLNATSQGYGHTEFGSTSDFLLTTNVSVISNEKCAQFARQNFTGSLSKCLRLSSDVGQGINKGLFCSTGIRNEQTDVYSGPCEGDSGGPLFINHAINGEVRQTVEGIVSGGFAVCGQNAPAIFTRVAAYKDWIKCIIRNLRKFDNVNRARRGCRRFVEKFPPKNIVLTEQQCLDARK